MEPCLRKSSYAMSRPGTWEALSEQWTAKSAGLQQIAAASAKRECSSGRIYSLVACRRAPPLNRLRSTPSTQQPLPSSGEHLRARTSVSTGCDAAASMRSHLLLNGSGPECHIGRATPCTRQKHILALIAS